MLFRSALLELLEVGAGLAFKVWRLSRPLRALGIAVLAAAALAGLVFLIRQWSAPVVAVRITGAAVVLAVLTYVFGPTVAWVAQTRDKVVETLGAAALAVVGWLVGRVHLGLFDRLFLRLGRPGALRRR